MILALLLAGSLVAPGKSAGATGCARGCNVQTGECWVLLVSVQEDSAPDGAAPVLTRHFYYIGEPYPTRDAAICGAFRLRAEGVCVQAPPPLPNTARTNLAVETATAILSDGSEPSYPGWGDCAVP